MYTGYFFKQCDWPMNINNYILCKESSSLISSSNSRTNIGGSRKVHYYKVRTELTF